MNSVLRLFGLLLLLIGSVRPANGQQTDTTDCLQKRALVLLTTNKGKIEIALSNRTPIHRDNFLNLVRSGKLKGVLFHRVINTFMVQTGNLMTRGIAKETAAPDDTSSCTLPAEICYPTLFHKRGAVAAARESDEVNPKHRSSCTQFYIVTGKYFTSFDLDEIQRKTGRIMPDNIRQVYKESGGTPHLDGAYTVFGEVVSGMKTVEKIERLTTDAGNRPIKNLIIKDAVVIRDPADCQP